MLNKYVIGGGINGLIWAYFHRDYKLIAPEIGGQLADPWTGPRLLNDTPDNRYLLQSLGLPIIEKICKVGFLIDGELKSELPEGFREDYYKKSRGLNPGEKVAVPDSVMSSSQTSIDHLAVDWSQVIERLSPGNDRWVRMNVDSLSRELINDSLPYDHLVWTPPLTVLLKLRPDLAGKEPLIALDKVFDLVSYESESNQIDLGEYDYVYVPEWKYSFHRITKTEKGNVFEWTGKARSWPVEFLMGKRLLRGVQISSRSENSLNGDIGNIKLLGRLANWNHRLKIEDVVNESRT